MIGATVVAASVLAALAQATAPAQNGEIAFARRSGEDASSRVYIVNRDGTGERAISRPPAGERDERPDWVANGAAILFERCTPGGACHVHRVRSDGTGTKRLSAPCPRGAPGCAYRAPAQSPDGRRIAFTYSTGKLVGSSHAALVVADANLRHAITVAGFAKLRGSADAPAWSPDGARLAFGVIRGDGAGVTSSDGRALFVIGADGKRLRRVTPWSLRAGDRPDWAPDGGHVLVRSESHRHAGFGSNLYTVRADGSGLRRLTRFPASRRVLSGTYAPDGTAIAIATTEGSTGLPDIYVIRLDGGGARRVTRSPEWDGSPDWGPRR